MKLRNIEPDMWVCWLPDSTGEDLSCESRDLAYQHAASHNSDDALVDLAGKMEVRPYYSEAKVRELVEGCKTIVRKHEINQTSIVTERMQLHSAIGLHFGVHT